MSLNFWLSPFKKTLDLVYFGSGKDESLFCLKTAKGTFISLKELEALLQSHLSSEVFPAIPLDVRCFLKDETLIVLVQYPEPIMPYPRRVFRSLRSTLEEQRISAEVLMYLVVQGNMSPALTDANTSISDMELADKVSLQLGEQNGVLISSNSRKNSKKPLIFMAAGMAVCSILMYGLTRPCVVSECSALPLAKKLAEESVETFANTPSTPEIIAAKSELVKSIEILKSIPLWSSYSKDAANLEQVYQEKLTGLENIVTALETGGKAATMGENPPYSAGNWYEIQQIWSEAIASLKQVKKDSEFYNFAQTKIKEYENNSAIVQAQLNTEKQAAKTLKIAQEAGKIAEVRAYAAQSLSNWQLVEATWETAISQIKQIPPQTTIYEQAQDLAASFSNHLTVAKERKNNEQFALKIYNQAISQAQLAQHSESINQWSDAVFYWEEAMSLIKDIPQNSYQYRQAIPLANSYSQSLENSQAQLQIALTLQQANTDLEKTCSNISKICDFTVEQHGIKVRLTPTYMQDVWQAALVAKAQENMATQVQILDHISTLEKTLEIISINSGIPLEVYNADGILVLQFTPN